MRPGLPFGITMTYLGWIGNVFIVAGLWGIGNKARHAFIASVIGEVIWLVKSLYFEQYDLAAMCVVFAALAARSWWKWGNDAD